MADETNDKPQDEIAPQADKVAGESIEESLDDVIEMDEDLAEALGAVEDEGDFDIDAALAAADPDFGDDLGSISREDFSGVVIEKDNTSEEVDENEDAPSAYKALWNNMPDDIKIRYYAAIGITVVTVPLALLIYMGKILPSFELPYVLSMEELSQDIHTYPTDGVTVPLFDEFRTKAHTVQLPMTNINLKPVAGRNSYGQFQFSIVLRDKEMSTAIEAKQSEIIDLIQRVLEQITWDELQTPFGKEKAKKVIRHRINEYLQGNVVLGVYYKSVILDR